MKQELTVGTKLFLRYDGFDHRRDRKLIEVEIIKLGIKYFYVAGKDFYGTEKFEISTLAHCVDSNYKYSVYFSREEVDKKDEFSRLSNEIKTAFTTYGKLPYSLEQLQAIKNIINKTE